MQSTLQTASTTPTAQQQRQQIQQRQETALLFQRQLAQDLSSGDPAGITRAETLCERVPALCAVQWPGLAAFFPEAADLFVGPAQPGAPPRAITGYEATAWARWREARPLFDAGRFDQLERYCADPDVPGRRLLCGVPGLGWAQDYAAQFDPAAEPFFGPEGIEDTLANLLLWRRQQAERRRRALYGLSVAHDEWLAEAEDRVSLTDAEPLTSAIDLAGAPENNLALRARGLLGTERAVDIVPLGGSAMPPLRVSPIAVIDAPIQRWTPETIASGGALANVPGGTDALIAAAAKAISEAELRGLDVAADAAVRRLRTARDDAAIGAITAEQLANIERAALDRMRERDAAASAAREGDVADIGTAFPGTGVYLMRVFVGDDLMPAVGVIPATERSLPPPDCPDCIRRMAAGQPPIIGAHPRH
ncbi:hypothetical protein pkur_cds_747 [Pandoravirus kuranda]|uniref:Uncharacterized protein n=1 Tax=Pandoravirus kuranda TaxID=3019033 RepID=A0AA95ENN3_9VIRU|nr:hypothetical protein pkur_cds_747 [Pandoravirus kuranda]